MPTDCTTSTATKATLREIEVVSKSQNNCQLKMSCPIEIVLYLVATSQLQAYPQNLGKVVNASTYSFVVVTFYSVRELS